jgi:biopolymer transport protein TolR
VWSPSKVAKERIAKRRAGAGAIVNVAPLAAIMFVLLFIMMGDKMVVIDSKSTPVDLPVTTHADSQPGAQRDDAILVTVARDGGVFLNHVKVDLSDLPEQIRDKLTGGLPTKVYLSGDARAKYRDIQAVVAKIQEAGITDMVILTEKSSPR